MVDLRLQSAVRFGAWAACLALAAAVRAGPPPAAASTADEITPALTAITAAQGSCEFELVERLRLSSLPSSRASAQGRTVRVQQTVSTSGEMILADVGISMRAMTGPIETRVQITPGELVVLAESGYGPAEGSRRKVYYAFYGCRFWNQDPDFRRLQRC